MERYAQLTGNQEMQQSNQTKKRKWSSSKRLTSLMDNQLKKQMLVAKLNQLLPHSKSQKIKLNSL
jgi:hypothetical protein